MSDDMLLYQGRTIGQGQSLTVAPEGLMAVGACHSPHLKSILTLLDWEGDTPIVLAVNVRGKHPVSLSQKDAYAVPGTLVELTCAT